MSLFTPFPVIASGSTDGRPIKVVQTATAGTVLHTAVSSTDHIDEVDVYACNHDSAARLLTLEMGGVTDPDDLVEKTIQPTGDGWTLVVAGHRMQNGDILAAFAAVANLIVCDVRVTRYHKIA